MQSCGHIGSFLRQPQAILRCFNWLFCTVAFVALTVQICFNVPLMASIMCWHGRACVNAIVLGILALLGWVVFLLLDFFFPQISNAKERKYIVTVDLIFAGLWILQWFVCYCVLSNLVGRPGEISFEVDQALVDFSFFSILSWSLLFYLAYKRYHEGVTDFNQEYSAPVKKVISGSPPGPYHSSGSDRNNSPYPNSGPDPSSGSTGSQQSPVSSTQQQPGEYQPPPY